MTVEDTKQVIRWVVYVVVTAAAVAAGTEATGQSVMHVMVGLSLIVAALLFLAYLLLALSWAFAPGDETLRGYLGRMDRASQPAAPTNPNKPAKSPGSTVG